MDTTPENATCLGEQSQKGSLKTGLYAYFGIKGVLPLTCSQTLASNVAPGEVTADGTVVLPQTRIIDVTLRCSVPVDPEALLCIDYRFYETGTDVVLDISATVLFFPSADGTKVRAVPNIVFGAKTFRSTHDAYVHTRRLDMAGGLIDSHCRLRKDMHKPYPKKE